MSQPTLEQWLSRKPAGPKPKKPLPRATKKRAKENRIYNARVKVWLTEHPVDEVWCKENGWSITFGGRYVNQIGEVESSDYLFRMGAPRSTQCHHRNKRRGVRLLDEKWWLAVSAQTHDRIEQNKGWARANGYLLNF